MSLVSSTDELSSQPEEIDWQLRGIPVPWRRPLAALGWLIQITLGTVTLTVLLAFVAVIPVLNLYALGFLLDAEGRVARSGRIKDAFWMWGIAPRLGTLTLGIWVFLMPIRLLSGLVADAKLIAPEAQTTQVLSVILILSSGLVALHLLLALSRGGTFGTFLRPIKNVLWFAKNGLSSSYWKKAGDEIARFVGWLELRRLWSLGAKGFLGTLAWLLIPTALYIAAEEPQGGQILMTLLGFGMLTLVMVWLPALTAQFASTGHLKSCFVSEKCASGLRRLRGHGLW